MTPMTPTIVITEHFNNLSSQPTNNKRNNKPKINLEEILTQIESVSGKIGSNNRSASKRVCRSSSTSVGEWTDDEQEITWR